MFAMFDRLNTDLRKLFALMGGVFLLFKLIERIELPERPEEEGFATQEFDDIW